MIVDRAGKTSLEIAEEARPENLRSFLIGLAEGGIIVVLVYAMVTLGTFLSGTRDLVPGAANVECMVIFGVGFCVEMGTTFKYKKMCRKLMSQIKAEAQPSAL